MEFLEVLRFVVQSLLHIVGLRAEPPNPIRSILSEKNKPALEHFRKTYDAEFSAMADIQMLEPWLPSYSLWHLTCRDVSVTP